LLRLRSFDSDVPIDEREIVSSKEKEQSREQEQEEKAEKEGSRLTCLD